MSKVTLQHILDNSMVCVAFVDGHAVEHTELINHVPTDDNTGEAIIGAALIPAVFFDKEISDDSAETDYMHLGTFSLSEELSFNSNKRTYIATNLENDEACELEVRFSTKVEPEQILKGE